MASLCRSTADDPGARAPATKICATIGPASQDVDTLRAMLRAGMSLARINLTWGPLDFHRRTLANLQTATRLEQRLCGVVVGTSGREIPVIGRPTSRDTNGWWRHTEDLAFEAGARVVVTAREGAEASGSVLPIGFKEFAGEAGVCKVLEAALLVARLKASLVSPGDVLYVGRYMTLGSTQGVTPDPSASLLTLRVLSVSSPGDVECEALNTATLSGLSLAASFPDMIDFVAVSYVRCATDVAAARAALDAAGLTCAGVAAEVNTAAALGRFAEILDESNAVILNRGALGLEVPPEKLCPLQKALVLAANLVGKPVAINMLVDSMVGAPRPTRAEATDVANAVLDGVDALQCGAETLRGSYPVDAVSTLARICREAELVGFEPGSQRARRTAGSQ
ncbi:hypothetical protein MNEG_6861 [Monoraphidium neglectum]|uniref:Pyruvate kinase n=1 Tax=Monoraphidium neglectum TaxID=145388 RepID=A0A0D2JPQ7_9CHLO|nr:hypothetical protein MNEG_6861 [Monoraphidium neglectum]KIZ01098.1 hypothetical protein MNEG_6861 [Monoraphidium neglectum]|eukprot:XP_013900117.1 hypothetical protein MNEG_6861 [Monoraphidium neglectum]